jgi:hypothetical protein
LEITSRSTKRSTTCVINIRCCNDPLNLSNKQAILKGLIDLSTIVRDNPQSANP